MANAVVTSDSVKVKVAFNDLASTVGRATSYFSKSSIIEVYVSPSSGYCTVILTTREKFLVSTDGAGGTIRVDTIDGVTPTDNAHIMDLIAGMMV